MFGDNIIPDDMLDGFYDKKPKIDASNNIVDASNNIIDASNNPNEIKPVQKNTIYGGGGGGKIRCLIRPINKDGIIVKKLWENY